ncbi:MAG: hypothetical protein ACI3VQ_05050 [Faecousia sp.]
MGCFGSSDPNAQLIKQASVGKNEEQRKVIEYFLKQEGCLSKNMTDDEYLALVRRKRDSLNLKQKALSKIGLDEDELQEIPPIMFEGFTFKNAWSKRRANGNWVSSAYQVSWLFFSATEVYIYQYTMNMDEDKKSESTEEYFYRDVTSFNTKTETENAKDIHGNKIEVESNKFAIIVPGATLCVALDDTNGDFEAAIQGMKQKLREKKMQ